MILQKKKRKEKKNAKISHKGKVRFFRWKLRSREELGHLPQNNLGQRADLWMIFPTLVTLTKRLSKSTNVHIWRYRQKFRPRWPFFIFLNSFFIWNSFFWKTEPRTKKSYSSFSIYFSTQNYHSIACRRNSMVLHTLCVIIFISSYACFVTNNHRRHINIENLIKNLRFPVGNFIKIWKNSEIDVNRNISL